MWFWFVSMAWGCTPDDLRSKLAELDEQLLGDWTGVPVAVTALNQSFQCQTTILDVAMVVQLHRGWAVAAHAMGNDELAAKHLVSAWLAQPTRELPQNLPKDAKARLLFASLLDSVLIDQSHVPLGQVSLVGGGLASFTFEGVPAVVQPKSSGVPQLVPPLFPAVDAKGRSEPGAPK